MAQPPLTPPTLSAALENADDPHLGAWRGFWQAVGRFDSAKMVPNLAFRNTLGVVLALAIGAATQNILTWGVVATGALNVSYSDDTGPYRHRAQRMLRSSLVGGLAGLIGSATGDLHIIAILLVAVWAFCAGMMVSISTVAADLGVISVVVLVVSAAKTLSFKDACGYGLLLLGGGLLQTMIALAFWPVRRHEPERRALAMLYAQLAAIARESTSAQAAPPVSTYATQVQQALAGLGRTPDREEDRIRALLDEAERIRLSVLALHRLAKRLSRELELAAQAQQIPEVLQWVEWILTAVGERLARDHRSPAVDTWVDNVQRRADDWAYAWTQGLPRETAHLLQALAGQLRAAVALTREAMPEGLAAAVERDQRRPWRVRWTSSLATLRANLSLNSAACRHALRLAGAVALGEIIGRGWDLQRAYWVPMTIVIVLKPDFTSTFTRGTLRVAGTLIGLLVATGLYRVLPITNTTQLLLLALFMFLLRWVGPAHYGVFVVALSGLIVVLFSLLGVTPHDVILARGFNTIIGGLLALLAYVVWPTWERSQIRDTLARLLDAYRSYARAVGEAYTAPGDETLLAPLDEVRIAARLARSNAEASADRLSAEPRVPVADREAVRGMLAHSNRFIHAVMALEAGLWQESRATCEPRSWQRFVRDVDLTLYYLADALRRPDQAMLPLPDLRADQRRLCEGEDTGALLTIESDRITDSLNTMREHVERWSPQAAARH